MIVGVAHYCENEACRVEMFSVPVDAVAADQTNCPGCGQFGRTKGRHYPETTRRASSGVPTEAHVKGAGFEDPDVIVANDGETVLGQVGEHAPPFSGPKGQGRPVRDQPQA